MNRYIWKDGEPKPEPSLKECGVWVECYERRILLTYVGEAWVSTVFLPVDHSSSDTPVLFETMIFAKELTELNETMTRYCTKEQAERGHKIMVEKVREFFPNAREGPTVSAW